MTLIVDPDDLNQGVEITIDTGLRTFTLSLAGNLSEDGVIGQALYSFFKEEWKDDPALPKFPFPMEAISSAAGIFSFVNGWTPADTLTRKLLRDMGWEERDTAGVLERVYSGFKTLGSIDFVDKTNGDVAYYFFASDTSATFFDYAGPVNEAVQVFGSAGHGGFDVRAELATLRIRIEGKTYDDSTTTDIGVVTLANQLYQFPLSEGSDLLADGGNIVNTDTEVDDTGTFPQYVITLEGFATPQVRDVSGNKNYGWITDCDVTNVPTLQEIYTWHQRQLRQTGDINSGGGTMVGLLAPDLSVFVGDRLDTLQVVGFDEGGGVGHAIDDFDANDTNNVRFIDNAGVYAGFPFVAAGTIFFNEQLQTDAGPAEYSLFFTYTVRNPVADLAVTPTGGASATLASAGSNLPTIGTGDYFAVSGATEPENNGVWVATAPGSAASVAADKYTGETPIAETAFAANVDFDPIDSPDATIILDDASQPIAGSVPGPSVSFTFDYDGNVQGGRPPSTDAPFVTRAIGLDQAKFTESVGVITRNTGQTIQLQAAQERDYNNPV